MIANLQYRYRYCICISFGVVSLKLSIYKVVEYSADIIKGLVVFTVVGLICEIRYFFKLDLGGAEKSEI